MIRVSRIAGLTALAVAIATHAAIATALVSKEKTLVEAAGNPAQVRLGNSFADMVQGVETAEPVEDVTDAAEIEEVLEEETPDEVEPVDTPATLEGRTADATEQDAPEETPEAVPEAVPEQSETATPPDQAAETPNEQAETGPVLSLPEAPDPALLAPVAPEKAQALTSQPLLAALPAQPVQADRAVNLDRSEKLESAAPETSAVTRSLRPKPRSKQFEVQHKPKPKPKPKAKPAPKPKPKAQAKPKPQPKTKPKRGAGEVNTRAGAATGKQKAANTRQGNQGKKKQTGNAAASNYPGKVRSRIGRVRRPRVSGARGGTATVSFTISSSGGLASARVSRSSGVAAVDQAALQTIRRAAPFPKPPPGAQRAFNIPIKVSR